MLRRVLGKVALCLHFCLFMMGMLMELESAQLWGKLEVCWCGSLKYADDIALVADSGWRCRLCWRWLKRM